MTRLLNYLRGRIPWIRFYYRGPAHPTVFTGPPNPATRIAQTGRVGPAPVDWEPLRQLHEWSVS